MWRGSGCPRCGLLWKASLSGEGVGWGFRQDGVFGVCAPQPARAGAWVTTYRGRESGEAGGEAQQRRDDRRQDEDQEPAVST